MARLNEPPLSTDSLETLRRKMLRQNRDLAKSNNIRALRIRDLENEVGSMLSENLELRSRNLELEAQVKDADSRRIADHALAIKHKLESQLSEWGTLLAGLGEEPPMKKHSPRTRSPINRRMSFRPNRSSPSQRRLRDVAREIEGLGYISETKRMSMSHDQIMALKSESSDSPEIGPPPTSNFIDEEPVKIDSPSRAPLPNMDESSPKRNMMPPVALQSPSVEKLAISLLSPEKKKEPAVLAEEVKPDKAPHHEATPAGPAKVGLKRKFAIKDDIENVNFTAQRAAKENKEPRTMAEKASIRERAGGKTLKEMANMRKETRGKPQAAASPRKPLAAKSTNDDVASPQKKNARATFLDEVAVAKAEAKKPKAASDRIRPKTKHLPAPKAEVVPLPDSPPRITTTTVKSELERPLDEPGLLSPTSPDAAMSASGHRGDTPPPTDITSTGETSRPSRRSRASVSYAEPSLRDKMRRPSKQLFDAVAGEGKYARRMSLCEPATTGKATLKQESDIDDAWKQLPVAQGQTTKPEHDSIPTSPLARKALSTQDLPSSVVTDRRRRRSSMAAKFSESRSDETKKSDESGKEDSTSEYCDSGDVDVYEFAPSSPALEKHEETKSKEKATSRQGRLSRRSSAAVGIDHGLGATERSSSRRRSMML